MTHEEAQAFARKCLEYWKDHPDGQFEIETTVALATNQGMITKSYPGSKIVSIDFAVPYIHLEVPTKAGVPLTVLIPFGNVATFTDMTAMVAKMAPNIDRPPQRKIVA